MIDAEVGVLVRKHDITAGFDLLLLERRAGLRRGVVQVGRAEIMKCSFTFSRTCHLSLLFSLPLDWESRILEDLLGGVDVGALEPDDERQLEADGFAGVDDAVGDGGAVHDAAEHVHQDGLHAVVLRDDAECLLNLVKRKGMLLIDIGCSILLVKFHLENFLLKYTR